MVLKPQLQELLSKQFLKRPWESISKNSNLLLAVVSVGPDSLFLSDGILTVQTSRGADLAKRFRAESGFNIQLADLEGFVCLFENCRIEIAGGERFERPRGGGLADVFRKRDFRSEAKRGEPLFNGVGVLSNLEQVRGEQKKAGAPPSDRTVIDLEASRKGPTKRIKKKNKKKKKLQKPEAKERPGPSEPQNQKKEEGPGNPMINFYVNFDQFSVICPLGKYFLSGKREMIVESLSEERRQFFERKFKLERHIKKMRDPEDNSLVPVLELGDIIEEIHGRKKTSGKEETRTMTSTPSGDSSDFLESHKISSKFRSKKKRSKKKRKL